MTCKYVTIKCYQHNNLLTSPSVEFDKRLVAIGAVVVDRRVVVLADRQGILFDFGPLKCRAIINNLNNYKILNADKVE